MAHAHDLLTARSWTGADLSDVVDRVLKTFAPSQVEASGAAVDLPPGHALAIAMSLHELATNAIKYGALSSPEGRIDVRWKVRDRFLHLNWEERGGPTVRAPTRKGFGSRLLERTVRGLDGKAHLSFEASGLRCRVTVRLQS